jgi:hypothetical protein
VFDGNAKDFYVALDDSADKLVIGEGSTVGTNNILTITDDTVTLGDGAAVDTSIVFDGNAQDFYVALDDSADDLLVGVGSTVGSSVALSIDENQVVTAETSANIKQVALTDGTVSWDARAAANAFLLLEENSTISAPTNAVEGAIIQIEVAQHASSGPYTLAFNAIFEFPGDENPTMTATDAKTDIFAFRYNGNKWQNIGISQNLTQS